MQINSNYQNYSTSFGMLKKSRMNAVERTFAEMTKPPLEKFNKIEDLYKFSDDILEAAIQKTKDVGIGFQQHMADWKVCVDKLLNKFQDGHLWRAIVYSSIQNDKHDYIPLCLEDVVETTIKRLEGILKKDSQTFNFHHEYTDDLNVKAWEKFFHTTEKPTGWIKFERGKTQEETDAVINDIRLASTKTHWCTKTKVFADMCIDSGNFYVYYKDGYPTLGVRTQISHGYKDEQELTYEIKNWLNEAYDKHSSIVDDLQKNYPNVVVFDNNISMI